MLARRMLGETTCNTANVKSRALRVVTSLGIVGEANLTPIRCGTNELQAVKRLAFAFSPAFIWP